MRRRYALIALCKTASGGAALDRPVAFHEQGTFERDGVRGAYDEFGDLRTLRTVGIHHFADHEDAGGFDGKQVWRRGADGVVRHINDPGVLAAARLGAYVTIGGYFYPNRFPAVFKYRGRQIVDDTPFDVVSVTHHQAATASIFGSTNILTLSAG